jgi:uncharacterized protein (DUF2252 family)
MAEHDSTLFRAEGRTRRELRALGKSLRQKTPRRSHTAWSPPPGRIDPVALLRSQDAIRVPELVPIRYGRMVMSPFAFFRGAAAVMAADLAATPVTGVNVQACGDAHFDNFGIYASPERRLVFDVNDFDETLPGPWEYDLKRLVVSLVLIAREAGWGDEAAADAVIAAVSRYRDVLERLAAATTLDIQYALMDEERFFREKPDRKTARRARRVLARADRRTNRQAMRKLVRVVDGSPRFRVDPPLLTRLSSEKEDRFHRLNRRHVLDQFQFRDVARKVVGIGSVGLRAYVVLLEGRGRPDPLVLQVKEATSSVLSPGVGLSQFTHHGQRVVVGQRRMQAISDPFLGWAPLGERDFYVRQLRDHKGPSGYASDPLVHRGECSIIGGTLARAHARSVDPALLRGYVGTGDRLAESLVGFAVAYADQAEADHERLSRAVRRGLIPAEPGV